MSTTPPPQALRLLPWRLGAIIFLTICLSAVATYVALGPEFIPGSVAGIMLGFFGTIYSTRWRATENGIAVLSAIVATMLAPEWVRLIVISPVMAALVGRELVVYGTRTAVFALLA